MREIVTHTHRGQTVTLDFVTADLPTHKAATAAPERVREAVQRAAELIADAIADAAPETDGD